jgi:predicted lipoprotein with Yx(FWY)xxD motif
MRRTKTLLAATGITAVAAAAPIALAATGTPTVNLTNTSKGMILTNKGYTLFMFSRDKANKDNCVKIKGCTAIWPPLLSSGTPKAGSGVNQSLLGTTKLPSGKKQVTYNKHPLYRYKPDLSSHTKGDTTYIGAFLEGGYWWGVNASGKAVK